MISKSLPGRKRPGLLERLKSFLRQSGFTDPGSLEELEEILISADTGVNTALKIIGSIEKGSHGNELLPALRAAMLGIFMERETERELSLNSSGLSVILVIGVNGTGKTTTTGKLALYLRKQGKKALLSASDTFRAGAVEQLEVWAKRAGAGIVKHGQGADPSAVAFDAVDAALARNVDVLLVDTAGRLHTKVNLMEELKKIKKVIGKRLPGAPQEVMLVLDATTGQNALMQAKMFAGAIDVTSLALVKLDGTAGGGIVLAIEDELGIPVKIAGFGEGIEDIELFEPEKFVDGLLGLDSG